MPVTRKPIEDHTPPQPFPEDPAFQDYLRKGGSAASPPPEVPKDVRFTLHIPGPLCQQLDQLRRQRQLKISRHQWVLEAILEKVRRERESGVS